MNIQRFSRSMTMLGSVLVALSVATLSAAWLDIREPPSITEPPFNQIPEEYVRRGGKVLLPCEATGIPEPTYMWTLNGADLDLNKDNIKLLTKGNIEITDFEWRNGDQGAYQCIAVNKYGKALSQIFNIHPAELSGTGKKEIVPSYGDEGKPLIIKRAIFESAPKCNTSYEWKTVADLDDPSPKRLVRNKRILQDLEGNLYFTSLKASDALEGGRFYKVDVFNRIVDATLGGSYSSISVDNSITPTDRTPYLLYPSTSNLKVEVLEGKEMQLQCIFAGHPEVDVSWSGPAKTFAVTKEAGTQLYLKKMLKEAAGEHECVGINKAGNDRAKVIVEMHTIPKFTEGGKPTKQTLSEEETATFVCQTTADTNPPATVKWMINGVAVNETMPGARTEVTTIENGKKMKIVGLRRDEDIKVIQCLAANKHKKLYINAPLIVLKRTKLTEKPTNQVYDDTTVHVKFVCKATSDPSTIPVIEWLRDGQPVPWYHDPRMEVHPGFLQISLEGLSNKDLASYEGDYTCNATNGYTQDSHTATLVYHGSSDKIREPPGIKESGEDEIPKLHFRPGSSFILPCVATGIPTPLYTWEHDGKTLDLNTTHIEVLHDGYIRVVNAGPEDSGTYQCFATNRWGRSLSQLYEVHMAYLGNYADDGDVKSFLGTVGKPLEVKRRYILSIPKAQFTWKVAKDWNSWPVVRNQRVIQDLEGNLWFTSVKEEDALTEEEYYKVYGYNSVLDIMKGGSYSRIVITDAKVEDSAPVLRYPTQPNKTVLEGEEMSVQCIFSGHPDVNVTWNAPIKDYELREHGTVLLVKNMTVEAAGDYICIGRNTVAASCAKISVKMNTLPKFTEGGKPTKQTLSEEDTATFVCQTTADTNPPATVKWMINGEFIDDGCPGVRTEVKNITNGKTLTITDLNRDEDIKVLQCQAANIHKTVYADAPLNVLLRTKLTVKPEDTVLDDDTPEVILTCAATSDPSTNITLSWLRNGKPVDSYNDPRMEEGEDYLRIQFDEATPEVIQKYEGEYTCKASNGYTNDSHTALLDYRCAAENEETTVENETLGEGR